MVICDIYHLCDIYLKIRTNKRYNTNNYYHLCDIYLKIKTNKRYNNNMLKEKRYTTTIEKREGIERMNL